MNDTDLAYMSIAEQAALIRAKEISPVDLVELYLNRIERWDGTLRAYITVLGEQARQKAKQAEQDIVRGHDRGPLHGIP
ncbi:MAG: amidase family protein, partial [Rhodospirillales bacterium]